MNTRKVTNLLIISLVLILAGSLLAWYVQTSGGEVEVHDVRFTGSNGTQMSGLLYIPPNATSETPAPGVLAVHGYINSRETQDGFAIEFSRRGYVVLALDQTGHGYSDPPAFANGFGGPDGLRYLRSLDIVDPDNIGLEGHSMGGWTVLVAAGLAPDDYKAVVLEGSSTGTLGAPEGTPEWPRNLALVYSRYDEFSALMWGTPVAANVVGTDKLKTLFNTTETVQPGKVYGSIEAGNARVLYQPPITHPADHLSTVAIGHALDWFAQTLEGGSPRPASDQVWLWKEIGNLIALVGFALSLFPLGALLLRVPYFRPLQEPLPPARPVTGAGWWIAALITVLVPILTFFPLNHLADAPWQPNAIFPQNLTTGIMFWALGNGLISLVLFLLWHYLSNQKKGASAATYGAAWGSGRGARVDWGKVGRSFLLAALIALLSHLLLSIIYTFLKVDYRFWIVALKPMSPLHFRIFLGYLIPFTLFFLISSTVMHGQMRLAGRAKAEQPTLRRALLTNALLMAVGFVILLLVQYIPLFLGGTLAKANEPLLSIVAFQFVPLLALAGMISTYFFRKTGHIYVGAFLNAIIITWYIVAGQATHFPL